MKLPASLKRSVADEHQHPSEGSDCAPEWLASPAESFSWAIVPNVAGIRIPASETYPLLVIVFVCPSLNSLRKLSPPFAPGLLYRQREGCRGPGIERVVALGCDRHRVGASCRPRMPRR
jgi:hypothetical protein